MTRKLKRKLKQMINSNDLVFKLYKRIKDIIDANNLIWYFNNKKNFMNELNKVSCNQINIFSMMEPDYGNIGDSAIALTGKKLIKDNCPSYNIISVSTREYEHYKKLIKKVINSDDIIITLGGGNMGNQYMKEEKQRRDIINSFENRIISFPQSIYFSNDWIGKFECSKSANIYNSHKDLVVFARDKISYSIMKQIYTSVNVQLAPDIVLYNDFDFNHEREGALLLLRDDVEGLLNKNDHVRILKLINKYNLNCKLSDTVLEYGFKKENSDIYFMNLIDQISKSKFVVTDRLHGMIFAAITSTPCIVLPNYNHKIFGQLEWLKEYEWIKYIDSIDNLENAIDSLIKNHIVDKYNLSNYMSYYNKIVRFIEGDN